MFLKENLLVKGDFNYYQYSIYRFLKKKCVYNISFVPFPFCVKLIIITLLIFAVQIPDKAEIKFLLMQVNPKEPIS